MLPPRAKWRRLALDGAPVHGRDTAEQTPCSRECARVLTDCQTGFVLVQHQGAEPGLPAGGAAAGKLPGRRPGQEPDRGQPVVLAGGLPAFTVITTSTQSSARPSISSAFPAAS